MATNADWRIDEVLKLLRQCVTCPACGSLVSTQAGIDLHTKWHDDISDWVAGVQSNLQQFSDYIINPTTGLEKKIQDRLDTITNYVIAPVTGLEPRTVAAITATNAAVTQLRTDAKAYTDTLRSDATGAITGLSTRITALETAQALGITKTE